MRNLATIMQTNEIHCRNLFHTLASQIVTLLNKSEPDDIGLELILIQIYLYPSRLIYINFLTFWFGAT